MSSPRPRRRCYTDSGIRSLPNISRKAISSIIANLLLRLVALWILYPMLGWRGYLGAWVLLASFRGKKLDDLLY